MLIVLFLSVHVLLILIYAMAIELNLSRHSYVHLLFAAMVPLAGELCLLASEFGRTDTAFRSERLFRYKKESSAESYEYELSFTAPVTREVLLTAIETKPKNMVEILKNGVSSDDIEIAHISAAAIMKLQREHEKHITDCKEDYKRLEDNMDSLKRFIAAVDAYYSSGLLEGEAAEELLSLKKELSGRLLRVLPGNEDINHTVQKD